MNHDFILSVKISKCSGSCNKISDPMENYMVLKLAKI